jgi:signal transduction histidine kinase
MPKRLIPTPSERNINRLVLALVSIGFVALVASVATVLWFQNLNERHVGRVEHTHRVIATIEEFSAAHERVEAARRGFLLDRDPSFLRITRETLPAVVSLADQLGRMTADNPAQRRRADVLAQLVERQQAAQRASLAAMQSGRSSEAQRAFASGESVAVTRQIRALTGAMKQEEEALLASRRGEQERNLVTVYVALAGAGLLLLLVAAATLVLILRFTRELDSSRAELRRLNEDLEGAVRERTVELQRANDEIQRFAYIVSHDLRSPLVNVMGFTSELEAARKPIEAMLERVEAEQPELASDDARLAVREDLPESIGFIRTSTQKMDRLINAILRLSREGRRTLTPEPVAPKRLISDIVASLQHRIDAIGASVETVGELPDIVSDRLALEQIFSNLIENALKYLQPGRPGIVKVRAVREGARIAFEVEDNGRGIDPRDHERVFDLFRRSGAQDQPGEGIGLAHVRALAYRLGGVIGVTSELDRGATFRLSLPVRLDDAERH